MSNMIPDETVEALRKMGDVSVNNNGIDCDLYIISNAAAVASLDIYAKPTDATFVHYTTKVWIEWTPNIYRLRALGMHVEDELPILARFGRLARNDEGSNSPVNIIKGSYIKIEMQYIPETFSYDGIEEFDIVDIMLGHIHDAVTNKQWIIAPRRVEI